VLIWTTADEEGFIVCWLACGSVQWTGKYRDGKIHLEIAVYYIHQTLRKTYEQI